MSTLFIKLLNSEQETAVKAALADLGHEAVSFGESEAAKLWAELQAKEPTLVADIKTGIADLKSSELSGGEKIVKVAGDVLQTASDAVKAIPGIKDLIVHGVTEVFADTESEVVTLGAQAITALPAALAA